VRIARPQRLLRAVSGGRGWFESTVHCTNDNDAQAAPPATMAALVGTPLTHFQFGNGCAEES